MKLKVLVTGGTGFIGSHLIPRLQEEGHDVYSLSRYVTSRYVLGAKKNVKTVFADIREAFRIREVIKAIQPDVVFHLAAISAQSYSYAHPQEVMETNYIGTINLAEACYKLVPHFKHFIFAGTAEEYGIQPIGTPINENASLNPHSPYAVSKVCADYYLAYMFNAYGFPATIMRAFNTYGRVDNAHFLVERVITQMLSHKSEVRLGDPEPVISWMYIDDHVEGYLAAFGNPEKCIGGRFNLSTKKGYSVKDVAKLCRELSGFSGEIVWNTIPERPIRVTWLVGDASRAKTVLGWEALIGLEDGLENTVDYWKKKGFY